MTSPVQSPATTPGAVTALDAWSRIPSQDAPDGVTDSRPAFIEPLVVRMSGRYDVPAADVRQLATEIHAQFVDVPVRSFVEVLVEKQIRDTLSGRSR